MNKKKFYTLLNDQTVALIEGEPNVIANLANVSALLFSQLNDVNWAGFYLVDGDELVLGPFQGNPACVRIPIGKGVCGTAASTRKTQCVKNVHEFDGHIACDAASNSEIVIPLLKNDTLIGVLDLDSAEFDRFDISDQSGLENIASTLIRHVF